jgi:hypothetical protein
LPEDPLQNAPDLDKDENYNFDKAMSFLWEGPKAVQKGVVPGTLDPNRVTVLRGLVHDKEDRPLPGVTVTVHKRPEYGSTRTRADGTFDMAVNAGGFVTLGFDKLDYLPAQRRIMTRAHLWDTIADVALVELPLETAEVLLNGASHVKQAVEGEFVSDFRGTRQGTLVVEPGTSATIIMEDGSRYPADKLTMFAKEYTTGADFRSSLPGELPATTMVNYAVEISAVELHESGAKTLQFSKPAQFYVDNFYGLPPGTIVPVGYYDYQKAAWVASDNGAIIDIVNVVNGKAVLLMEKNGTPNDPELLGFLGIDEAELVELAQRYGAGTSLSRVVIQHLTPYDFNYPFWVDDDENDSEDEPLVDSPNNPDDCKRSGSILYCQSRALGERIDIPGTDTSLVYKSSRTKGGSKSRYSIKLPAPWPEFCSNPNGGPLPGMPSVAYQISIAGQTTTISPPCDDQCGTNTDHYRLFCKGALAAYDYCESYAPGAPLVYTWDGKDMAGREVSGNLKAVVTKLKYYPSGITMPFCGQRVSRTPREGFRFVSGNRRALLTFGQNDEV